MSVALGKAARALMQQIAAGERNPYEERTEGLICEMVGRGWTSAAEVQAACDRYVQASAVAIVSHVASGRVRYDDRPVRAVLDRAVELGIIDASVLEHMGVVYTLVSSKLVASGSG